MALRWMGRRALVACSALGLAVSCSQLLQFDEDYSLGPGSSTGGTGAGGTGTGGTGTGGTGTGGTGTGGTGGTGGNPCPDGEQDNDHDGSCQPACAPESCSGNGTCDDTSGAATCTCEFRFSGPTCADCAEGYAGPDCLGCAAGYQDKDDDGTCLPECSDLTCSGHGACDDSSGTATCTCHPDVVGDDCATPCQSGMAGPSCSFRIIFGLEIPPAGGDWNVLGDVPYDINNSASAAPFDRVASRLILDAEEVWVETDPYTANAADLGIPVDVIYDVPITNVTVLSFSTNQPSISVPTDGNVEMWSNCYAGGANSIFDYDDAISPSQPDCYGSFQVHVNMTPALCFNRWSAGPGGYDLGIGPAPTGNPDWTFAGNSGNYSVRRLEVYIREQ